MSDTLNAREIPLGPGRAIEITLSQGAPHPDPKPIDPQVSALDQWFQQLGPSKPPRR